MKNILLILSLAVLCSCSANFHKKRSKHHLDKAISKGYQPFRDTTRTLTSIKPVELIISTPKRTLVVNTIDSILKENNCLDTLILTQIMKVVDSVPKYIDLDTVLIANNGAELHLTIKDGKIYPKWENIQVKETVYVRYWPLWLRILVAVIVLLIVLLVLRWLFIRLLKGYRL